MLQIHACFKYSQYIFKFVIACSVLMTIGRAQSGIYVRIPDIHDPVDKIIEYRGTVFVQTSDNDVYRVDKDIATKLADVQGVQEAAGTVWLTGNGLYRMDGDTRTALSVFPEILDWSGATLVVADRNLNLKKICIALNAPIVKHA